MQTFYVGTYTNLDSKGIYKYVLHQDGSLENLGLVAETSHPSYLALSKNGNSLVAVNENDPGTVTSFKIKKDTLIKQNQASSGGVHPCFVMVSEQNEVLVANYSSGSVGLLQLKNDGALSDLKYREQHTGKGITDRQEAPHAHSVYMLPESDHEIVSVDLGSNQLWFSKIQDEKLVITDTLAMASGAGPRHLAFHPEKNWIYVLNELDNTISLVKKNGKDYEVGQSFSMLPDGYNEFSKAADIHLSPDGNFLYASNRGHDSIVIYRISEDGNLKRIGFEPTRGNEPRNFALSPDGTYLIVANQNSDNLVVFQRNEITGKLSFMSDIQAPTPVCVLFEH